MTFQERLDAAVSRAFRGAEKKPARRKFWHKSEVVFAFQCGCPDCRLKRGVSKSIDKPLAPLDC